MAVKASSQMTLIDLTDAYSVFMTNEAHTFLGTTSAVNGTQITTTQIMALCGNDQVPCTIGEMSCSNGITAVSDGKSPSPTITITATSAATTGGSFNIPITINGDITITKKFSYSIAFKGATGATGAQGIQGLQGEKGEQGVQGPQGVSGKTSYFHIKYSAVSNPTTSSQMTEIPSTYIGTYVDYTEDDSTDPSKYTWAQFKGSQGAKGDQGIPGTNGTNGQTSYLHIAYATNANGTAGFSTTDGTGKTYIGQYTDFAVGDSTDPSKYTWTLIKGATGDTGPQGPAGKTGADAITMVVTSTNGTVFKNTSIATTLQAHVYKAGVEVTGTALSNLGTIKWYKDGSSTASATGSTLTISAGSVDNKATYEARLE